MMGNPNVVLHHQGWQEDKDAQLNSDLDNVGSARPLSSFSQYQIQRPREVARDGFKVTKVILLNPDAVVHKEILRV